MIHEPFALRMDLAVLLTNLGQELDEVSQRMLKLEQSLFHWIENREASQQPLELHDIDFILQTVEELAAFVRRLGPAAGPLPAVDVGPALAAVRLGDLRAQLCGGDRQAGARTDVKSGEADFF